MNSIGIMKNKITKKSTLRELMQVLGTEALRNNINNNIHVAATLGSIKKSDNVIITDTRFENELKAVKDRDGITIRVNRPFLDHWIKKEEWDLETKGVLPHESETALDNAEFDYVIENDGELVDLVSKVRKIMLKERLWQEKQ